MFRKCRVWWWQRLDDPDDTRQPGWLERRQAISYMEGLLQREATTTYDGGDAHRSGGLDASGTAVCTSNTRLCMAPNRCTVLLDGR
jgi:hypothetical protein